MLHRVAARAAVLAMVTLAAPAAAQSTAETLSVAGVQRTYRLRVPTAVGTAPVPLVIVLHGAERTGEYMERTSGYSELADRERFIAVYPDGIANHWHDGRVAERLSMVAKVDDVGFIRALVAEVRSHHAVDPLRIYVTGGSNGGLLTHRLLVELPDLFAAAVTVASSIVRDDKGKPYLPRAGAPPVSVLEIHGTDDHNLPLAGGSVRDHGGLIMPVADAMAAWARHDACPAATRSDAGIRHVTDWSPCRGGTEVQLIVLDHVGHVWPGRPMMTEGKGDSTDTLDATQFGWDFLKAHAKAAR